MSLNFKLFGILENIFFYSGRPVIIVHDNGLSPGQPGLISSEACMRYWWATSHCCNLSRKEHEGHVEKKLLECFRKVLPYRRTGLIYEVVIRIVVIHQNIECFGIDCHFHHIHLSAQVVDERRFLSICPAVFIDAHFTVSRTVLLLNTFPCVSWWTTAYFDCLQFCATEILLLTYSFTYSVILSYSNPTKKHTVYWNFGLTSLEAFVRTDQDSQYLQQICSYRSCLQWETRDRLGECQGDWSRIRQSWQTHKGGDMDLEDWQHESRRGELPTEPRIGQAFTYWQPAPEVSPDEGFRCEAEMSILDKQYVFRCIRVT